MPSGRAVLLPFSDPFAAVDDAVPFSHAAVSDAAFGDAPPRVASDRPALLELPPAFEGAFARSGVGGRTSGRSEPELSFSYSEAAPTSEPFADGSILDAPVEFHGSAAEQPSSRPRAAALVGGSQQRARGSEPAVRGARLDLSIPPLLEDVAPRPRPSLSLLPEQDTGDSVLDLVDTQSPQRRVSTPPLARPVGSRPVDVAAIEERTPGSGPGTSAVEDMAARFQLGDFTGALVIAESILVQEPDHAGATDCARTCRERLVHMYSSRLGDLSAVPRVIVPPEQITWLSLDHRTGFVLSLFDGISSVDDLLDICGMPRLEALRILHQLAQEHVIALDR